MPHVTATAPRRHEHARAAAPIFRAPARRRSPRLSPLNAVSLQVIVGLLGPLPFIQVGHWLFRWPSVAVMWGAM